MIQNVIKSWRSFFLNKSNKKTHRNKTKMLGIFTGMTSVMTNLKLHNFVIINQVATNLFNFFLQILNKKILKSRVRSFLIKKLSSLKLLIKGQWIMTIRLRTLNMAHLWWVKKKLYMFRGAQMQIYNLCAPKLSLHFM